METFSEGQQAALRAAGRLLQSRQGVGGVRGEIRKGAGERYLDAVARVARRLPPQTRGTLRELVEWVLEYEEGERREAQAATPPLLAGF